MADSHKILLDTEANPLHKQKLGTKRLFHERSSVVYSHGIKDGLLLSQANDSNLQSVPFQDEDIRTGSREYVDLDIHTEKRSRTSDWPLRSNITISAASSKPRVALGDRYDTLNSASIHRPASAQPRPSKFVEGSMNDRVSQRPHHSYISDPEDPWEQFEADQNGYAEKRKTVNLSGLEHQSNRSVTLPSANDKSGAPRSSSIFRFGKSVVTTFNPSSWKIWPKKQQGEGSKEEKALRERRERAEKIYKELKHTGQPRDFECETHTIIQEKRTPHKCASKDSIPRSVGSKAMRIRREKGYGQSFLDPSGEASLTRSNSPTFEIPVPLRNSSPHLQEPPGQANETLNSPQALRRLPSRKDLQKQQKLVKRVSDLEEKLETARRQLAEALGEPVVAQGVGINRARFTPGALASLPSERLLGVCTTPEAEVNNSDPSIGVGRAISIGDWKSPSAPIESAYGPEIKAQLNTILGGSETSNLENSPLKPGRSGESRNFQNQNMRTTEDELPRQATGRARQEISNAPTPEWQTTKSRKSIDPDVVDGGEKCKSHPDLGDDIRPEAPKASIPRRKPGRPRKLRKVDPEPKLPRGESKEVEHLVPGAVMEVDDSHSSHDRKIRSPNSDRLVLSKTASSASNSRIAKQSGTSNSPSLLKSTTTCTGYSEQRTSSGKSTLQSKEGLDTTSINLSAAVVSEGVPASENVSEAHNNSAWVQKKLGISNTGDKQPFEWPADIF